jgi:hypothetical protein
LNNIVWARQRAHEVFHAHLFPATNIPFFLDQWRVAVSWSVRTIKTRRIATDALLLNEIAGRTPFNLVV